VRMCSPHVREVSGPASRYAGRREAIASHAAPTSSSRRASSASAILATGAEAPVTAIAAL